MPHAKRIALVYADMPQSHSYRQWVEDALTLPEFSQLEVIFQEVEFVRSEGGHKRMAMLAREHIARMTSQVDAIMSPNDQMGVRAPFARMVMESADKPLVGLGRRDVMENWGATMAIFPSMIQSGKLAARMIKDLIEGKSIKEIIPRWPPTGYAFDLTKAKRFGLTIPDELIQRAGEDVIR
jgi:putative ABC transport system substrate-binding protein